MPTRRGLLIFILDWYDTYMSKLVIDIETVGEDYDSLDEKTQEVLTRWIKRESANEQDYENALTELKDGLGFSPLTGQIVAIGVLDVEKNKGAVYYQAPNQEIIESEENGIKFKVVSEEEMLKKFWEGAKSYNEVITFNGRAFDVPFIMVRSAIYKIRPSVNLMPPRYSSNSCHIDLADQLTFYGSVRRRGSLHLWCRALGIKSPKADGIQGDDVGRLFKEGKFLDIAKYNVGDLYATRDLYHYWNDYLRF